VSPVKYEPDFYIPEDAILHSDRRENLKSYTENIGLLSVHSEIYMNPDLLSIKDHPNCFSCKHKGIKSVGNTWCARCHLQRFRAVRPIHTVAALNSVPADRREFWLC
jgi:hypothetical protein